MTGVIILAAGESQRLGERKQKLVFSGKSLLQRTIDSALAAKCGPVIVVLGADGEEIEADIKTEDIIIHQNLEWKEGMASSIRSGITILQNSQLPVSAAIIMVCDQPYADASVIKKLLYKKLETSKDIIACSYNNTIGVPALFDKKHFPELSGLRGEEGAKKLIRLYKDSVALIEFPLGGFDIDTTNDYQALIKSGEI